MCENNVICLVFMVKKVSHFDRSVSIKDVHRGQKLMTDCFQTFELTILVVTISISRKKYTYRGFRGSLFKGLDNNIIGFVHIQ